MNNGIRILYYGAGWPTNIGNAFIDLGALALLHAAAPNAQIAFASEMPRWFFSQVPREHRLLPRMANAGNQDNALDVASITECDLAVFSGMAMCETFIRINGPTILRLRGRSVPILLLGTGAETYSSQEQSLVECFLRDVDPIGFISRDDRSYEMFSGAASLSRRGIDCGFFVSESYTPFRLALPEYSVLNFDTTPEPELKVHHRLVIRTHHSCWVPIPAKHLRDENTLISDIPYDYLTIYANAEEVHTDRVHASVAALAYGRRTKLYHATPRGSLFDAVGADGIRQRPVQLDMQVLEDKKNAQIISVREIINAMMPAEKSVT